MNTLLLIFFALPIAVIIISIALQKILKCPILVAAIIFSIFLIVTFILAQLQFLVATIVYAIISFITAWITCIICRFIKNRENNQCYVCCNDTETRQRNINCSNLIIGRNSNNTNSYDCNCNTSNSNDNYSNEISARIRVIPNNNENGNGCICGRYRRR